MCIFPTLTMKICVLVIIPITSAFCLAEITITTISLRAKKDTDGLLYLILVASILYLIALAVGYYGSIVRNIVYLQVMLFVIAGDLLVKTFISVICANSSESHKALIINYWFHVSFICSVLCFFFAFLYFLRLKKLLNDDD